MVGVRGSPALRTLRSMAHGQMRRRKTFSCPGVLYGVGGREQWRGHGDARAWHGAEAATDPAEHLVLAGTHVGWAVHRERFGEESAQVEQKGGLWMLKGGERAVR